MCVTHCHVYSSLAHSGQWSGNEIILPVTANLNFWSRAIFWNLALSEKCTDPERKCMWTRYVCGFFLTLVGSYKSHCFGINAHTFLFQVGHPTKLSKSSVLTLEMRLASIWYVFMCDGKKSNPPSVLLNSWDTNCKLSTMFLCTSVRGASVIVPHNPPLFWRQQFPHYISDCIQRHG